MTDSGVGERSRTRLVWAGVLVLAGAGGMLVGLAVGRVGLLAAIGVLAAAGGLGFVLAPREWQWPGLFALACLFPLSNMGLPQILLTITPWALLLGLLLVLSPWRSNRPPQRFDAATIIAMFVFTAWLGVCVFASRNVTTGVGLLISFVSLVVLPVLLAYWDRRGLANLRTSWIVIGGLLGVYALVEAYVLHGNPLNPILYRAGAPSQDAWSVYRATTTLGHPLSNGMFFAVAASMAVGEYVRGRSWRFLIAAGLSFAGIIASGARGALVAVVVGVAVALLPTPGLLAQSVLWRRRIYVALAGMVGMIAALGALAARTESSESADSGAFRLAQIPIAFDAMRAAPIFGVGPGGSSIEYGELLNQYGGAGAFESYWLELGVGAGFVGLGLGLLFFAIFLLRASWARDWTGAAGLCAWLVAATTVNAFEGGRAEQIFLGALLAILISGASDAAHNDPTQNDPAQNDPAQNDGAEQVSQQTTPAEPSTADR